MMYEHERNIAIDAVRTACILGEVVRAKMLTADTSSKQDRSPVTIADYAIQAQISLDLLASFPETPFMAEEDTAHLRGGLTGPTRVKILMALSRMNRGVDSSAMLAAIERGSYSGGAYGRFWALDPIDGTKGFLRGGQYAIALAMIENGEVVVSVLGCPNLPHDVTDPHGDSGCLFVAVRDQGAVIMTLKEGTERAIYVSTVHDPAQASIYESLESAHSDQIGSGLIAQLLQVAAPPLRMDSQCKYGCVGRGEAEIYLRLPTAEATAQRYEEKIWDHAAGSLLIKEAGGAVSDINGQPLDFSQGRTLRRNRGVVATNGLVHAAVLDAIQRTYSNAPYGG